MKLHEQIRELAEREFVARSRSAGKTEFVIAVRDLMAKAQAAGISTSGRTPAFCNAIRTLDFLDENGLEVSGVEGPQSKLSTTVVVHYRFRGVPHSRAGLADLSSVAAPDDPLMRLRGVLKGAMREGAAAFLQELRRDKENEQHEEGKRVA
jgi:hypothetical protein